MLLHGFYHFPLIRVRHGLANCYGVYPYHGLSRCRSGLRLIILEVLPVPGRL
jgi:hypothetical protein